MNWPGAAQPGGSPTGTLAQFFRRSGSLATGMVALEHRNMQFTLHRKNSLPYAGFAMVLSIIGTTIFVSTNSALPMLELSNKYYLAVDETQRMLIAAAGEAMLVRGGHGGLGVFIGFVFLTIASLCMSLVMLHGKIFNRTISYFGIIGNTLLLMYILLVTFVPAIQNIAVIIAAPGGLLALVWVLMLGVKLIKMESLNC